MFNQKYLSQFQYFFSNNVIKELSLFGKSKFISYIIKESNLLESDKNKQITFRDLFNIVYELLADEYRCEYIYKNAITTQLLIKRHSIENSTLLSEFRVGNAKADIVIINGSSSVYEIKTELDNLDRLQNQVEEYKKVFDYTYIVTYKSNLKKIEQMVNKDIGLIVLKKDLSIKTIRVANSNRENVIPSFIFDSLRRNEYTNIIQKEFGFYPDVPNTLIYSECKSIFEKLSPEQAHDNMVAELRNRKRNDLIKNRLSVFPKSLNFFCMENNLNRSEWKNFEALIDTDI